MAFLAVFAIGKIEVWKSSGSAILRCAHHVFHVGFVFGGEKAFIGQGSTFFFGTHLVDAHDFLCLFGLWISAKQESAKQTFEIPKVRLYRQNKQVESSLKTGTFGDQQQAL